MFLKKKKYKLEGDNVSPIENPSWETIEEMMSNLHPKERAFFILTEMKTGNFIQLAGARARLTVEARINSKKTFQHYRFGRIEKNTEKTYINCKVGPINVIKSQALTLKEASEILRIFFTSGSLSNGFELEDISGIFKNKT